jgi:hypothetical protein
MATEKTTVEKEAPPVFTYTKEDETWERPFDELQVETKQSVVRVQEIDNRLAQLNLEAMELTQLRMMHTARIEQEFESEEEDSSNGVKAKS